MACDFSGCPFTTEEGIPTHELRIDRLKLHMQSHLAPESQPRATTGQKVRPTPIPRPELEEDSTEQEWSHWKTKWDRYKRSCLQDMDEAQVIDHLWACCSKPLEDAIWRQAGKEPGSEADLLSNMKKLGVRKRNILLNKVAFLDMSQATDEPVKMFAARLRGQASTCDFTLTSGTTDYTEHMVQHQLIKGLNNQDIQEHILGHAATKEGSKMTLDDTINMAEAKEGAKLDMESLNKSSSMNRISEYRKGPKNNACLWCKQTDTDQDPKKR